MADGTDYTGVFAQHSCLGVAHFLGSDVFDTAMVAVVVVVVLVLALVVVFGQRPRRRR